MEFKELTIDELKLNYIDRHGFYLETQTNGDRKYCESISHSLIHREITEHHAEFVVEIDSRRCIFVYPEGASFDCPRFMQICSNINRMLGGMFTVKTLRRFLEGS